MTTTGDGARRVAIPLHDLLGLEFTWQTEPGDTAEVRTPVQPAAFGFTGNLHGGAVATMADVACALAAVRGGSRQSGVGRDGGYGLHAYSELQSVVWPS